MVVSEDGGQESWLSGGARLVTGRVRHHWKVRGGSGLEDRVDSAGGVWHRSCRSRFLLHQYSRGIDAVQAASS